MFTGRTVASALLVLAALLVSHARGQDDKPKDSLPESAGRPITILVTAAVGDGGVKDAEVIVLYWEDLKKDWGEMRITPIFSDWDEARADHGHKFTTDFGGMCIVPRPTSRAYVTVRIPGQFGFSQLDSTDASPFLMKLEVDESLPVKVVDKSGKPVEGICVGANMPVVRKISNRLEEDKVVWLVSGLTGSDGVTHLRNMQWWRTPPFKELRENPTPYQVEVAPLFKDRVFARFDPDAPPTAPIQLVVPETGRVVVPLPSGQRAYARIRAALPGTDWDKRPWPLKVPYRNESTTGSATFPHVELGCEIEYEVWWSGLQAPRRGKAKGPTKPGEEVVLPRLDTFEEPGKGKPDPKKPR
jgi:hypothetical protein